MHKSRVYADTSVFGGTQDEEFAEDSRLFFEQVRTGRFRLVLSQTVLDELDPAPPNVQAVLASLPENATDVVSRSPEVAELRDAYLQAGIVGPASRRDAEHIATASVAGVDLIVSWNFHHIVHYDKIRLYHAVNLVQGYKPIPIHTPKEVIQYEEERF